MRSFIGVLVVSAGCLFVYLVLLQLSAIVPILPTSHHSEWVSVLKEPAATRTHLDLVYAGTQWYERAVLFALAASVVACLAKYLRQPRRLIFGGIVVWLVAMTAISGPDVIDIVGSSLALIAAYGGVAIAEDLLKHRHDGGRPTTG